MSRRFAGVGTGGNGARGPGGRRSPGLQASAATPLLSNLSDLHSLYGPNPFALRRQQLCFNVGQGEAEDVAHYDPPGDFAGIDLWKGCRFHVGRGGGTTVDTHWLHLRQPTRHAH